MGEDQVDLFGAPVAGQRKHVMTGFGVEVDALARSKGRWPDDVVVYALKCVDPDIVIYSGGVPDGVRKDGRPKWPKKMREWTSASTIHEYRAALSKTGDAP